MPRTRKAMDIDYGDKIRLSLMAQLKSKGADVAHFEDQVNDYMALWRMKAGLEEDFKKRGVVYIETLSTGVKTKKHNQSVKDFVVVNKQMLSILKELGLRADDFSGRPVSKNEDDPL